MLLSLIVAVLRSVAVVVAVAIVVVATATATSDVDNALLEKCYILPNERFH